MSKFLWLHTIVSWFFFACLNQHYFQEIRKTFSYYWLVADGQLAGLFFLANCRMYFTRKLNFYIVQIEKNMWNAKLKNVFTTFVEKLYLKKSFKNFFEFLIQSG